LHGDPLNRSKGFLATSFKNPLNISLKVLMGLYYSCMKNPYKASESERPNTKCASHPHVTSHKTSQPQNASVTKFAKPCVNQPRVNSNRTLCLGNYCKSWAGLFATINIRTHSRDCLYNFLTYCRTINKIDVRLAGLVYSISFTAI
jgi:hypothetical protein